METINLEPNWQRMFDYAVAIARAEIPKDRTQGVVIEMLEVGKDIHASKHQFEVNFAQAIQDDFDLAISIVRAEIPENRGQQTVIEMLDYGKRLHAARSNQPKAAR